VQTGEKKIKSFEGLASSRGTWKGDINFTLSSFGVWAEKKAICLSEVGADKRQRLDL